MLIGGINTKILRIVSKSLSQSQLRNSKISLSLPHSDICFLKNKYKENCAFTCQSSIRVIFTDFKFIFTRTISKMPATQATLGYVKNPQTSLEQDYVSDFNCLSRINNSSKFFGKPKGAQIPVKQSKLSFVAQTPSNKNESGGDSLAVTTDSRKEVNECTENEIRGQFSTWHIICMLAN